MHEVDMIVDEIKELATLNGPNRPRIGLEMQELGIVHDAAIAIQDGKILETNAQQAIHQKYKARQIIHAQGHLVTPGFVDPHTHPVFAATREQEFAMRVQGATYQDIAKAGGGIRNSARRFQKANKSDIQELTRKNLWRFLNLGTTTIEAKSGYGLSTEAEIKSLEILQELQNTIPLDIVPTFLGAHEIPDEYRQNRRQYIDLIISEMIPLVAQRKLAQYCDVFCETHVFTVEETREILEAGKKFGLLPKLHADELTPTGGAELAAEMHATSADHLVAISDKGIQDMQKSGTVAVLLPATTFFLGSSKYAPGRKMIDAGVPVALATDFNPGSSMTQSMPLVLTIACLYLKMMPSETLAATTINSACAIGMQEHVGSLVPGKQADLLIWDCNSVAYLPYHFGDNLVHTVIKKGKVIKSGHTL